MTTITIDLEEKHAALLEALKGQSGADTRDVVGAALELLADAALSDGTALSPEQIAAIEEGLAALERGEMVSHEDVVADVRAKLGT